MARYKTNGKMSKVPYWERRSKRFMSLPAYVEDHDYDTEKYEKIVMKCGHVHPLLVRRDKTGFAYGDWLRNEQYCSYCKATKGAQELDVRGKEAQERNLALGLPAILTRSFRLEMFGELVRDEVMEKILALEAKLKQKQIDNAPVPRLDKMLEHISYWKRNTNPKFWIRKRYFDWAEELAAISEGRLNPVCGKVFEELNTRSISESIGPRLPDSELATPFLGARSAEDTWSTFQSNTTPPDQEQTRWLPAAMVRRTPRK